MPWQEVDVVDVVGIEASLLVHDDDVLLPGLVDHTKHLVSQDVPDLLPGKPLAHDLLAIVSHELLDRLAFDVRDIDAVDHLSLGGLVLREVGLSLPVYVLVDDVLNL